MRVRWALQLHSLVEIWIECNAIMAKLRLSKQFVVNNIRIGYTHAIERNKPRADNTMSINTTTKKKKRQLLQLLILHRIFIQHFGGSNSNELEF